MTEILTESFCERCGTRYTFESSAPRKTRLGRMRMLSKGVRNFVMSDETSFSEAMAEARSEEELAATAHQLDAFHRTFNFCMTCRQYTCGDCWNVAEGRCLTCAPVPGQEEPVFRPVFGATAPADLLAGAGFDGQGEPAEAPGIEAWPEADLPAGRLARVLDLADGAPAEPATDLAAGEFAAGVFTAADGSRADSDTPLAAEPSAEEPASEPSTDEATMEPAPADVQVRGIAPGQSLEDAVAAYEAMLAQAEAGTPAIETTPAPAGLPSEPIAAEPQPAAAAPEPEPIAAESQPAIAAPEPVPATPAPDPVAPEPALAAPVVPPPPAAEPPAAMPAAPAADDHVAQPRWPVRAPALPANPASPMPPAPPAPTAPAPAANPWLTVAPEDNPAQPSPTAPQWPATPQWPALSGRRETPMTLAGRPLLPQGDAAALWAASAQEVLGAAPAPIAAATPAPAQPCVSCGLSLSANARFCRRCGSRQG